MSYSELYKAFIINKCRLINLINLINKKKLSYFLFLYNYNFIWIEIIYCLSILNKNIIKKFKEFE